MMGVHIRLKGVHLQQLSNFFRRILTLKLKIGCWNSFEMSHQRGVHVNPWNLEHLLDLPLHLFPTWLQHINLRGHYSMI
eukprot:UN20162